MSQAAIRLVARIKKSSKYAYQAPDGAWFDVTFVPDSFSTYAIRGNDNNYRVYDLTFGVRLDSGEIIKLQ